MKQLQLLSGGTKSRSSNATSQSLVNMYIEQSGDKGPVVAYGRPGLTLFTSIGSDPVRGMYAIDDTTICAVHKNKFYTIDNTGAAIDRGSLLTSSGRVDMSHNTTQVIVVDGSNGYIYTISSGAFARITDADFPGADTVAFNNGRFIVNRPGTGQYWLSASYNGLSWVATDFATAEASPDNLVRVAVDHGELILFGTQTTEFAVDTGGLDFPYTRISGATAEWGLAARWSVAKFENSLMWLAKNRMGEVQVVRLQGYQLQRVSTFDIESIFNNYLSVSEATAYSYLHNGHPFYQINFNASYVSWCYDGASDLWSQVKYGQNNRHLGEISVSAANSVLVSEFRDGNIYTIDGDAYTDNGEPIYAEITCKHVSNQLERLSISALQVDCETGMSNGNPQIMLQVSKDNGHNFGVERWASLGLIGQFKARAIWRRLGVARDWVFRIRIVDDVKRVITGIWIS